MKSTTATTVFVLLAFGLSTAPASAGPFRVTLPVVDLEQGHLPAVQRAFEQQFARNVLQLKIVDGSLEFWAGGTGRYTRARKARRWSGRRSNGKCRLMRQHFSWRSEQPPTLAGPGALGPCTPRF